MRAAIENHIGGFTMKNNETYIEQIITPPKGLMMEYYEHGTPDSPLRVDLVTCLALVTRKYSNGETYQEVKAMTGGEDNNMMFVDEINGYQGMKYMTDAEIREYKKNRDGDSI